MTGLLHTKPDGCIHEGPWEELLLGWAFRKRRCLWPLDVMDRVRSLLRQLLREFEIDGELAVADDGAVWFAHRSTVPEGFDFEMCCPMVEERYDRLGVHCNRHGITIDTPGSIYVKVFFILCVLFCDIEKQKPDSLWTIAQRRAWRIRYADFLGLPMVANCFDGLCVAFVHLRHGGSMRTAWKPGAKTLADRDDALNNFAVEARTTNYLKWCFPEETYPGLKEHINPALRAVQFRRGNSTLTGVRSLSRESKRRLRGHGPFRGRCIVRASGDDDSKVVYISAWWIWKVNSKSKMSSLMTHNRPWLIRLL